MSFQAQLKFIQTKEVVPHKNGLYLDSGLWFSTVSHSNQLDMSDLCVTGVKLLFVLFLLLCPILSGCFVHTRIALGRLHATILNQDFLDTPELLHFTECPPELIRGIVHTAIPHLGLQHSVTSADRLPIGHNSRR